MLSLNVSDQIQQCLDRNNQRQPSSTEQQRVFKRQQSEKVRSPLITAINAIYTLAFSFNIFYSKVFQFRINLTVMNLQFSSGFVSLLLSSETNLLLLLTAGWGSVPATGRQPSAFSPLQSPDAPGRHCDGTRGVAKCPGFLEGKHYKARFSKT